MAGVDYVVDRLISCTPIDLLTNVVYECSDSLALERGKCPLYNPIQEHPSPERTLRTSSYDAVIWPYWLTKVVVGLDDPWCHMHQDT